MEISPLERLRRVLNAPISRPTRPREEYQGDDLEVRYSQDGYRYMVSRVQEENCYDECNKLHSWFIFQNQ